VPIPELTDYLPLPLLLIGAAAVLVAMLWLLARGRRWGTTGAWALLATAALWVPLNRPVEGPILARLGHDKGLTLADLLTLTVGAIAAWRWIVASKSERSEDDLVSVNQAL
jgi:hypothetical protein